MRMTLFRLRKQKNCYWRRWGIGRRGWKRRVWEWMLERQKSCSVGWVSMGQAEDFGEHPCGVCRKEVGDNSIFCVECHRWVHKRCRGISRKWRVMLISIVESASRVRMASLSQFAERGCDWAQCEVGMCSQVLLFGWHTWCGRRRGGGCKSQSKMCLG